MDGPLAKNRVCCIHTSRLDLGFPGSNYCSSTKDVFLVDLFLGIKFKFIAKSCEDDGTQLKRIKFQNSLFSFSVVWVIEFLPKIFKKTVAILGNKVLENLKISKSVTNKS